MRSALLACALAVTACTSSTTPTVDAAIVDVGHTILDAPPGAPDAPLAPTIDAPSPSDAPPITDAPPPSDAPPITYTLSINNYIDWCTITEDGVAFNPSKTFPAGTVVTLHADPLDARFVWGYWTGTDHNGAVHDTMQSTTVTMTGDKSVLACCPFAPPASQTCP